MSDIDRTLVYEQLELGQLQPVGQSEGETNKAFLDLCAAYFNTVYKPDKPAESDGVCYGLCMILREILSQTGSIDEASNTFYSQINLLTRLAERIDLGGKNVLLSEEEINFIDKVSAGTQLSMINLFHALQKTPFSGADVSSAWRTRTESNPIVIYVSLKKLGEEEENKLAETFVQYQYNYAEEIKSLDGIDWETDVSTELKDNKDFILAVLGEKFGKPKSIYFRLSARLQSDIDIIKLIIEKDNTSYPSMCRQGTLSLSKEDQKECVPLYLERKLKLSAFRENNSSLSFIPLEFREDPVITNLIDKAVEIGWFQLQQKVDWEKSDDMDYVLSNIKRYSLFDKFNTKTLVHPDLRNKNELVKAWVRLGYNNEDLRTLGKQFPEVIGEIETQKQIVLSNPQQFIHADPLIQGDVEFVKTLLKAKTRYCQWLAYASREIRQNKSLMELAINKSPLSLKYASKELRGDGDLVLAAAKKDGRILQYITDELKGDPAIVRIAIQNTGMALKYASDALKGDPDIVRIAIQNTGMALEYASDELKSNKDVILAAVRSTILALQYGDQSVIKKDLNICKAWLEGGGKLKDIQELFDLEMLNANLNELMQSMKLANVFNGCSWNNLPKSWQAIDSKSQYSQGVINLACKIIKFSSREKSILSTMPEIFQDHKNIQVEILRKANSLSDEDWFCIKNQTLALMIMQNYMQYFPKLSEELRNNKDFILNLIEKFDDIDLLCCNISKNLMKDHDICIHLFNKNMAALKHIDDSLQTDPEFWQKLIVEDFKFMRFAPVELRDNANFVVKLMQSVPKVVRFSSDRLKNDPGFMLKAVEADISNKSYISKALMANREYMDVVKEIEGEKKKGSSEILENITQSFRPFPK